MFTPLEILKSALGANFKYKKYEEGITSLRETISATEYYKNNWDKVIDLLVNQRLPKGLALK